MACPLKAILNNEDLSPRKAHGQDVTVRATGPEISRMYQAGPLISHGYDPPFAFSSNRGRLYQRRAARALRRFFPPFALSSNRGVPYQRRAGRSLTHVQNPPTLPLSGRPAVRRRLNNWIDAGPPSHETNVNRFSVFQALLGHPELTFEFAKQLDVGDLVSLYAISKDFHTLVDRRFTAMMLAQSLEKAPESSRTFRFKCYKNLCIYDPAARPNLEIAGQTRDVPSLRWLRMILFREKVVDEIISCLAAEGHRLPKRASLVIKKIWFTMDIGDNHRRIGLIHNTAFWGDQDLQIATWFFMKLDMRFTDPVDGNGEIRLSQMLFAERSLSTLWKVLKRERVVTAYELLQMYVRWNHLPAQRHWGTRICGVPGNAVGRGQLEGWGVGREKLLRPDELIVREAIRRRLDLDTEYLHMMLWGYIDPSTFEDIWGTESDAEEGARTSETGESLGDGSEDLVSHEEQEEMDYGE